MIVFTMKTAKPADGGDFEERYELFVKRLESDHWGDFAAVRKDGSLVLAPSLLEALEKGELQLGSGIYIYRVGEVAVGKWR